VDDLPVAGHHHRHEDHDHDRDRDQVLERLLGGDGDEDVEDLLGGVGRRRDRIGREDGQREHLEDPLVVLVGGGEGTTDEEPLDDRRHLGTAV
jgi:hypothetical protein